MQQNRQSVGPRIVKPHPGTNRAERRRAQAIAALGGARAHAARARIVEAASLLWHHGDADDPRCTLEGIQTLRAVHAAYDALTPGGDLAADVRAHERAAPCPVCNGFGRRARPGQVYADVCPACGGSGKA